MKDFFVATIIHNRDTENNKPKRTHLHAFIETPEKYTKKQFLGLLNDLLGINTDQITLELSNNRFLLVQYLIHKNDPTKAQYSRNEIDTNNSELLSKRLDETAPTKADKQHQILNDMLGCQTLTEFCEHQGVEIGNRYRDIFVHAVRVPSYI